MIIFFILIDCLKETICLQSSSSSCFFCSIKDQWKFFLNVLSQRWKSQLIFLFISSCLFDISSVSVWSFPWWVWLLLFDDHLIILMDWHIHSNISSPHWKLDQEKRLEEKPNHRRILSFFSSFITSHNENFLRWWSSLSFFQPIDHRSFHQEQRDNISLVLLLLFCVLRLTKKRNRNVWKSNRTDFNRIQ